MKGFAVFARTASKMSEIAEMAMRMFGSQQFTLSEFCGRRYAMSISRRKADMGGTETRHEAFQRGSERVALA